MNIDKANSDTKHQNKLVELTPITTTKLRKSISSRSPT